VYLFRASQQQQHQQEQAQPVCNILSDAHKAVTTFLTKLRVLLLLQARAQYGRNELAPDEGVCSKLLLAIVCRLAAAAAATAFTASAL
jgi:hypothetical protein